MCIIPQSYLAWRFEVTTNISPFPFVFICSHFQLISRSQVICMELFFADNLLLCWSVLGVIVFNLFLYWLIELIRKPTTHSCLAIALIKCEFNNVHDRFKIFLPFYQIDTCLQKWVQFTFFHIPNCGSKSPFTVN